MTRETKEEEKEDFCLSEIKASTHAQHQRENGMRNDAGGERDETGKQMDSPSSPLSCCHGAASSRWKNCDSHSSSGQISVPVKAGCIQGTVGSVVPGSLKRCLTNTQQNAAACGAETGGGGHRSGASITTYILVL